MFNMWIKTVEGEFINAQRVEYFYIYQSDIDCELIAKIGDSSLTISHHKDYSEAQMNLDSLISLLQYPDDEEEFDE